ncbi:MAG: glycosyltransferase family 4 protein [Verrucomicrobiales bacterium]
MPDPQPPLAYVFERFPSFTQTFCAREILELERQGMKPALFSIRDTRGEGAGQFPGDLFDRVTFLPPEKELAEEVQRLKNEGRLPQDAVLALRHWGDRPDKARLYEAAWIGLRLRDLGVRHCHSHFAGIGARTCWWLRRLYGITFSFTGHANDLFCKAEFDLDPARLMRSASLVVTVSDYTAGFLRNLCPEAAAKVQRVYNGLDLAPFQRAAANRREAEPPLIFSVGRLIEKKGFDDLIRACALLMRRGIAFRCAIAGDGPLEDDLRALIESEGVAGQVELLGPRTQAQIAELLAETAVFALPCVTEQDGGKDNLPTVIMEAMAARVPCVSTRLAGVPEMVIDGETGRLVGEREVAPLADAVAGLLADPALRQRFGEAGEKLAAQRFAKEVTAAQLRRLLAAGGLVGFQRGAAPAGAYLRQWLTVRPASWLPRKKWKEEDYASGVAFDADA